MKYQILFLGVIFVCIFCQSEAKTVRNCFQAKTCLHDGKEKCGENKNGEFRRFLDTCDMKEYNCLKGTDYSKVPLKQCQDLPPIPPPSKEKKEDVEKKEKSVEEEDKSQEETQPNEE